MFSVKLNESLKDTIDALSRYLNSSRTCKRRMRQRERSARVYLRGEERRIDRSLTFNPFTFEPSHIPRRMRRFPPTCGGGQSLLSTTRISTRGVRFERLPKAVQRLVTLPTRPYSNAPTPPRQQRSLVPLSAAALVAVILGSSTYYLSNSSSDSRILAPDRWTPLTISSVEQLTPDTSLFRFDDVPESILPPGIRDDESVRPILSLYVKEPSLQIQRAYTVSFLLSFPPRFSFHSGRKLKSSSPFFSLFSLSAQRVSRKMVLVRRLWNSS
jgi:hypothetical protein